MGCLTQCDAMRCNARLPNCITNCSSCSSHFPCHIVRNVLQESLQQMRLDDLMDQCLLRLALKHWADPNNHIVSRIFATCWASRLIDAENLNSWLRNGIEEKLTDLHLAETVKPHQFFTSYTLTVSLQNNHSKGNAREDSSSEHLALFHSNRRYSVKHPKQVITAKFSIGM